MREPHARVMRRWRKKRRAWLQALRSQPCADCGGEFHHAAMEFDHVRGRKRFTVGQAIMSRKMSDLLREMAKCDIVCANCHRIRTWRRHQ